MGIFFGSKQQLGQEDTAGKQMTFFFGLVRKNVLVTGSYGQLGREIEAVSKRFNSPFYYLYTDKDTLDITNYDHLLNYIETNNIQYIINCAAYTDVDKAESDADKAYTINRDAVSNIAKAAAETDCFVIHISSDYVFDGKSTIPYNEKAETNPISVYGESKLKGEDELFRYAPNSIIIRTSWLFSEYRNNFVKTMIQLMTEKESLNIVNDRIGSPTYAADLAEMIIRILQDSQDTEWKPGLYHFANMGSTSWFDFASEIKEVASLSKCQLKPITTAEYPTVAARPTYSVMNTDKISSAFNIIIPDWKDALKRCINKISNNNINP